jgi:AcrR family transcriptional regulator
MPSSAAATSNTEISPKIRKRQSRTRGRITHESARLFIQKGFENVSVEDIIDAADIARSSFYRFFSNREEVLADIIRPVFEQGLAELNEIRTLDPKAIMEGIFQTFLDLWKAGNNELRTSTRVGGVYFHLYQDIHNDFRAKLTQLIKQVEPSGILLNDDTELTGRLLARTAVSVMEVYQTASNFEELFKQTMRGMLLKPEESL